MLLLNTYFGMATRNDWLRVDTRFQQDRLKVFMAFSDIIIGDAKTYYTQRHVQIRIQSDLKRRRFLLSGLKIVEVLRHLMDMIRDGWMVRNSQARQDLGGLLLNFADDDGEIDEDEDDGLKSTAMIHHCSSTGKKRGSDELSSNRETLREFSGDRSSRKRSYQGNKSLIISVQKRCDHALTRSRFYIGRMFKPRAPTIKAHDLGEYDMAVRDQTPLPVTLQHDILTSAELLLESACYTWIKKHHPPSFRNKSLGASISYRAPPNSSKPQDLRC